MVGRTRETTDGTRGGARGCQHTADSACIPGVGRASSAPAGPGHTWSLGGVGVVAPAWRASFGVEALMVGCTQETTYWRGGQRLHPWHGSRCGRSRRLLLRWVDPADVSTGDNLRGRALLARQRH